MAIRLEREIRLGPHQRRIQHHGASIRLGRLFTAAQIAEYEANQIKGVGILRVQLDRPLDRAHRVFV
jgi:hypothetical protein